MTVGSFRQLRDEVFRRYVEGRHGDALALVEHEAAQFPDRWGDTLYWRGCLTAVLGDAEGAVRLLEEAVERGHWWSEGSLRGDPDLQALQGAPRFEALVGVCRERHREAERGTRSAMLLLRPGTEPPWPLLLALHGSGGDAAEFAPHWEPAAALGWLVGVAQSAQATAPGRFGWADRDRAGREVRGHYETIAREHRIDPRHVIVAGFSQGGAAAIWMVLSGLLPARGILGVACAPRDLDEARALVAEAAVRPIRVYLVVGDRDHLFDRARRFCEVVQAMGIDARLEARPGLGHEMPPDFHRSLGAGLQFLCR